MGARDNGKREIDQACRLAEAHLKVCDGFRDLAALFREAAGGGAEGARGMLDFARDEGGVDLAKVAERFERQAAGHLEMASDAVDIAHLWGMASERGLLEEPERGSDGERDED